MDIEKTLFAAADKMRGAMDAGEYKHVALGLLFLRYVSVAFERKFAEFQADDLADENDPEEYLAESVFWVPEEARWSFLAGIAKSPEIGVKVDDAMRAMARALYRSWFVDFDPVHAKAEGREPAHMDAETAALFPDNFGEDGLPEGWTEAVLGDVVKLRNERVKPSEETKVLPYLPIDCIEPKSLTVSEAKRGSDAKSSLVRFEKGDILFGAMRPYFHKVAIAPFRGTTRTTVFTLCPHVETDFSYSVMLLHEPATIEYATAHSTGSTIPYAKWNGSMETMPVLSPPSAIRKHFDRVARPLLDRISVTFQHNKSVADLRDALLPKLMSGEIRVREAEEMIEEVA